MEKNQRLQLFKNYFILETYNASNIFKCFKVMPDIHEKTLKNQIPKIEPQPNMLLTVINDNPDELLKFDLQYFSRNLVKIAQFTGSWIITKYVHKINSLIKMKSFYCF